MAKDDWTLDYTPKGQKESEHVGRYPSEEAGIREIEQRTVGRIQWTPLIMGRLAITEDGQYMLIKSPVR